MEKIFFKFFDFAIAALMGVGSLLLVCLAVGSSWNMFLAMCAGMVIGMFVLFVVMLATVSITTLFQLLPVGMLITMPVGMLTAMAAASTGLGFTDMIWPVVLFSLFVQLCIDIYNIRLKGEVRLEGRGG